MDYFSPNAFLLGTFICCYVYVPLVVYTLLCIRHNIKILEFTMFFNLGFSLNKSTVKGTKFALGWFPFGGFVKPLGMDLTEEERMTFSDDERPHAFFTKPKHLKTLFKLTPILTFILAFCIGFLLFTGFDDVMSTFEELIDVAVNGIKVMFGNEGMKEELVRQTVELTTGKSVVLFAFSMLSLLMIVFGIVHPIVDLLSNDEKDGSKVKSIVNVVVSIVLVWAVFWKIPTFLFSFFSFSQFAVYLVSLLFGLFLTGIIGYFLMVIFFKFSKKVVEK